MTDLGRSDKNYRVLLSTVLGRMVGDGLKDYPEELSLETSELNPTSERVYEDDRVSSVWRKRVCSVTQCYHGTASV
jgi:hypothetical protein